MLKVARYEDNRGGPIGIRAMPDDPVAKQRMTMTFTDLRRFDASALEFTREELPALRDAELAKLETDGVQARPEHILAAARAGQP